MRSIVALVLLLLFVFSVNACHLTFSVSNEFPPHHIKKATGNWTGISLELFELMANNVGCEVEVVSIPWERSMDWLKKGNIDAVSLLTKTPQREGFAYFVGPHYMERIHLLIDKSYAPYVQGDVNLSLFPGLIGKTRGVSYGPKWDKLLKSVLLQDNLVQFSDNALRLAALKRGKIDATVEEASVASHWFATGQLDREAYVIKSLQGVNPVYFGFSKQSVQSEWILKLEQSWQAIRNSEQYYQINKKYGLSFKSED